jgi:hypothetical protein
MTQVGHFTGTTSFSGKGEGADKTLESRLAETDKVPPVFSGIFGPHSARFIVALWRLA